MSATETQTNVKDMFPDIGGNFYLDANVAKGHGNNPR